MAICHALSHPVRGAWIEMPPLEVGKAGRPSHPVRGAWIEIPVA